MFDLLDIRLGAEARRRIERDGLKPEDIAAVPAAAGGPKGLALLPFDRMFASEWLPRLRGVELIGASIGAWRMASLAQSDPLAALARLQHAYVREQNYDERPSPSQVAGVCRGLARSVFGAPELALRDGIALSVITARARGALADDRSKLAFGRVALVNAASRRWLANHMERVVFHAGAPSRLPPPFDGFGLTQIGLTRANVEDALLASGSIPLVCDPVCNVGAAPPGDYWDGGLIDYHLLLPYDRFDGIVLYPHFVPYVTPGWLDKFLPWRKRPRRHHWLANVVLIAPSRAMLDLLPNRKLPDRSDFYKYGQDHAARVGAWERAIAESERFAEASMRWLEAPDTTVARTL
ncbi:MAG: patatin-like phospholipase family protein [Burkholderiaceae bacterium]